jgi:hypothetical protein
MNAIVKISNAVRQRLSEEFLYAVMCNYKVVSSVPNVVLRLFIEDPDWRVRMEIARRIDRETALLMSGIDADGYVRRAAFKNAMTVRLKPVK